MPLTKADIKHLKKAGFKPKEFAVYNGGMFKLRNVDGYCFFYDKKRKRCRVYRFRPEGCRIYPVVWVDGLGVKIDKLCPMKHTITKKEFLIKKRRLLKLIKTLGLSG